MWHCFLPAAAAPGSGCAALVLTATASAPSDAAASEAGCAALAAAIGADSPYSLIQLCAPGSMRIRRLHQALQKGGDLLANSLPFKIVAALSAADFSARLSSAILSRGSAPEAQDALAAWVQAQSEDVKCSPSFARGLVAEAVFASLQSGEDVSAQLAGATKAVAAAIEGASLSAAGVGLGGRAAVEAFCASGAQIACACDEAFPPEAADQVFASFAAGALSSAGLERWLGLSTATTASGGSLVAEPVGRKAAEIAVRAALAK